MFNLSIDIRKLGPVIKWLKSIPRGAAKVALPAIAEYLIGDGRHGLKHYRRYKYVSRARAYPDMSFKTKDGRRIVGYKSLRQFRFVMASISQGRMLPGSPRRTGKTQRGYHMVTSNGGYRVGIRNTEKGAIYTRHDRRQARLNALAGWQKSSVVIANNLQGAFRHAWAKVREYLKQR